MQTYCETHPEDPGCDFDPGPDEGGDPGDGEPWACELEPELEPCQVCVSPKATEDDCHEAWHDYCSKNHKSQWCEHGEEEEPEAIYAPTSLLMKIYSIEFSADAEGCTDPIVVGAPDEPEYIDFAQGPEIITADPPPPGSYPCVIITMSDHIRWNVDGDTPCSGEHEQDVAGDHDGEGDGEEIIRVYLSTAGGLQADHPDETFEPPGIFLDGAHEAGPHVAQSTFVVSFPEGVSLRRDHNDEPQCEMAEPGFSFETEYES